MTPYHPNSSVVQRDRITLMMEARQLTENVGFVKGHQQKVQLYAAGHLVYEPDTGDDGADSEISEFLRWWMPRADYGYEYGFSELFGMGLMGGVRDGDALLVWVRDEDGLRLQLVEADQIGELDSFRQQPDYVSGVFFDERGIKTGYRVYDRVGDMRYDNPQFVPVKDAIFLANRIRPGARGITDYETSIKNLKDKFEILEYEKIVVKDISETGVVTYTQRAQADEHDYDREVINDNGSVSYMRRVEGGLREYLGVGEKFEVVQNNRVSPTFSGFLKALDAESCHGLRLPYGFVVDPSEAGGASIRLIANMASREFVRVQQVMLLPRLEQIRDVLLLDAADRGEISWHPNLLRGQWMFPPPPTADVQRESDIAIKEIRSGMSTWEEQFATWGQTRDRQWKIRKQEIKDRRRLAWEAEQELRAEGIDATVSPDEIAALSDNPVGLSVGREEKAGAAAS